MSPLSLQVYKSYSGNFRFTIIVNNKKLYIHVLINKEIPKVTYYYVLILNLNLKCIINFLKVISISKEFFI